MASYVRRGFSVNDTEMPTVSKREEPKQVMVINLDTATDSCMGSGSLLLNAKKYAAEPGYIKYYGQELNTSTYNLARMNMFLHGIVADNQHLRNGDTLDGYCPSSWSTF